MAYTFQYRLQSAPEARSDGSGGVSHDIWALYSEDGENYAVVPGRHKTIVLPGAEFAAVMAMPHSTGPERQAKIRAYKDLLVSSLNYQPTAITGWSNANLAALLDNNALASQNSADANSFITETLSQNYPMDFNL